MVAGVVAQVAVLSRDLSVPLEKERLLQRVPAKGDKCKWGRRREWREEEEKKKGISNSKAGEKFSHSCFLVTVRSLLIPLYLFCVKIKAQM